MTPSEDHGHPALDQLVREYLARNTADHDPACMVNRIFQNQTEVPSNVRRTVSAQVSTAKNEILRRRLISWWSVSALAIMVAFLCGRYFNDQTANASVLLKDVRSVHNQGRDYCYRVQFDPDPRYWNPSDKLGGPSLTHLWTRGDRFWASCVIGDITFKLGREANGTVWISPSADKGIRFSNQSEKLPKVVSQICQINSMDVPLLMDEVLIDFDLNSRAASTSVEGKRTLVWAQLKPGRSHPLLSDALLEIDPQTNILQRLVLWTVHEGKPRGTVAFTLLEAGSLEDQEYELDFHLSSDAVLEIQTLPSPDYQPDFEASSGDEKNSKTSPDQDRL